MRIGLYLMNNPPRPLDRVIEQAQRAEAAGLHTFWISQLYDYDALTLLALLGRETHRIELGTWIVPTFPRHPSVIAQQALTAQAASDGRVLLGIGLSHKVVIEKRLGLDFARPIGHMREYLEVLLPLLEGEEVHHKGAHYRVRLQLNVPRASRPPVLVAALGPQMLRLAGRLADGAAIWLGGEKYLREFALPTLREAAESAGRPAPRVVVGLPVAVCDDVAKGREAVAAVVGQSAALPSYRAVLERGGVKKAEDVALVGDEARVGSALRELAALGVDDFNAIVVATDGAASVDRTIALLAEATSG
jgi:F420-dependent oxidoreductase-like protein